MSWNSPFVLKCAETFVRAAMMLASGWLVARGLVSEQDANAYVTGHYAEWAAGLLGVLSVLWGLWDKYSSSRRQATTVAALNVATGPDAKNITVADIDKIIKLGDAAPASTPHDEVPVMTGTGNGLSALKTMTGTGNGL